MKSIRIEQVVEVVGGRITGSSACGSAERGEY